MLQWEAKAGHPVGASVAPRVLWDLARRWYDDRLDLAWSRKTIPERVRILDDLGLTGPFWAL